MAVMTTRDIPVQSQRHSTRLISILALVAAILGAIISFTGWGILLPIAGIVLGAVASRREKPARALWLTAIVLGIVGLLVSIVSLFFQYLSLMALIGFSTS
jgi:hypothetical protein